MLELSAVTIVMMSDNAIVMIALVSLCGLCKLADPVIGQCCDRLSKPGVMRNTAAKQHGRRSEGLQRQRQQKHYDSEFEATPIHGKNYTMPTPTAGRRY